MKKKWIRFIRNTAGLGYGYMEGQEYEFTEGFADEMIELGVAISIKKDSELPTDFPGYRVLLENGITSYGALKKIATIDQLTELKGIGKKLAESIIEKNK
jgi:DNA uptake protein ComE-like DNA-binding protein